MAEIGTIAEGLRIVGEVRGRGALRIDGVVDGAVRIEGSVLVSAQGLVEGSIEADRVRIDGRLVGNGRAHERLETGPNACVDGDLGAPIVRIDPLSAVTGEVLGESEAAAAPRGVRRRRGSSPEAVRRVVPEPKMPVMLRAKGVRRSIA
jgi:cytoskeletal protein CcmA (bactofilin family)